MSQHLHARDLLRPDFDTVLADDALAVAMTRLIEL